VLGRLRPIVEAVWQGPARFLVRRGVSPNTVTVVGTVGVVASALAFFPRGGMFLFWGAVAVTFFVVTDMLDGTMARLAGRETKVGAFLDSTLDRVADAAIFGALSWAFLDVHRPTALAGLIALAFGSVVPYARAKAESLGVDARGGIAERGDRIFLVLIAAAAVGLGLPWQVLTVTFIVLGLASFVTVIQRTMSVVRAESPGA